MDLSEFKGEFINEAKNQLDMIDQYLEALNENGFSVEKMTDLKRAFHTLKGNSATMGYMKYFELAKAFNDLCQAMIEEKLNFDKNYIALFKEGKERLDVALSLIEEDKSEQINDDELTNKVNGMIPE